MARVRVPVDETSDESISAKAAQLLGEERTPTSAPKPKRQKPSLPQISPIKLVMAVLGLLLIIMLFVVMSDRNSLKKQVDQLSKQPTNQESQAANELVSIQIELNKFMELPTNETPTLATVSDVEKVKGQTFFKNAQNGDKVLLYSQSGKAILYRPSTKKVIEVAQINPSTPGTTTQP
jgi:hypothetical protein